MGSGLKQFIYGAGFLLFFSAVIFGIYALMFRSSPTCFDGRQNGEETGIDCGGGCMPCAQKYAQGITVGDVFRFASDGKVVVVAAINNPNDDYGFKRVTYTMKALDANGQAIASASDHAFVYDRKTKGDRYLVDTLDAPEGSVANVTIDFSEPQVVSREEFSEPNVNINRSSTDIVGLKKITEPVYVFTRNLRMKATGADVQKLEEFLRQRQFLKRSPGGTFDTATRAAVIAYQKSRKIIPATGEFGTATRKRVNAEVDRVTKLVVEPGGGVSINGDVKNSDIIGASKVVVTGLLFDASGSIVGGSKTELDAVDATEERTFKILFPKTVPIDRVDTTKTRLFVDSIK